MTVARFLFLILIAGLLAAISVNGFIFQWDSLGTAGRVVKEILTATASGIVATALIEELAQKKALLRIQSLLESPQQVIGRLDKAQFPAYFREYIEKQYEIPGEAATATLSILADKVYSNREIAENDERDIVLTKGTSVQGYKTLVITQEYTLHTTNRKILRFCCRLSGNRDQQIHEADFEVSWMFLPAPGTLKLPQDCFRLLEVRVNDVNIQVEIARQSTEEDYVEYVARPTLHRLDGAKIYYRYTVLQAMHYGFVTSSIKRLSRNASFTFNYFAAEEIEWARVSTAFLSQNLVRELCNAPRSINVKVDGWILPRGGCALSWNSDPSFGGTAER